MEGHYYPRRRFLGHALAACTLSSLAATTRAAPSSEGVRLAVRGPFPQRDLRARAELLSRLGYQGIELGPEYLDQTADQILVSQAGDPDSPRAGIRGQFDLVANL